MLCLPTRFAAVILSFAPLFFQRSWRCAEVLLVGAILAPGKRTVTSLLRVIGLARERRFVNLHRVLSRATWSSRAASHLLLDYLIKAFAERAGGAGHRRHHRAPPRQADRHPGHPP